MLIPLFILSFFIHFILADDSNVLVINSPQPNQQISSKSDFGITYTIVGGQATNPPFAAYYFHSLSADFIWKEHSTGQSLSFTIASSLDSSPYPNGLQNKVYNTEWKVPNCHFFSRYPPSQYDYSILFTPSYLPVTNSSPATGPEQSSIVVPITIQVHNDTFPKC